MNNEDFLFSHFSPSFPTHFQPVMMILPDAAAEITETGWKNARTSIRKMITCCRLFVYPSSQTLPFQPWAFGTKYAEKEFIDTREVGTKKKRERKRRYQ